MNTGENLFRTAAFGGFQKQDVLSYIETSAREHSEKLEALQTELDQLRQGRGEMERRAREQESLLSGLTADKERLERELAQREEELGRARAEAEEKGRSLAQAQAVAAEQLERLRAIEPAAEAYESIKNRTAGVELEAHHRAQLIEEEARVKAKETMRGLEQWLVRLQAGYDRLRTDLDATISHAAGELERVSSSLCGLTAEFDEHEAALTQLKEDYHQMMGPTLPEPLPLEE